MEQHLYSYQGGVSLCNCISQLFLLKGSHLFSSYPMLHGVCLFHKLIKILSLGTVFHEAFCMYKFYIYSKRIAYMKIHKKCTLELCFPKILVAQSFSKSRVLIWWKYVYSHIQGGQLFQYGWRWYWIGTRKKFKKLGRNHSRSPAAKNRRGGKTKRTWRNIHASKDEKLCKTGVSWFWLTCTSVLLLV